MRDALATGDFASVSKRVLVRSLSYGTRLALASVLRPFGTFAEIHSTHPGALMHYSRFQSPVVNPDSSPPVRSPVDVYRPWENTRDLPVFIL